MADPRIVVVANPAAGGGAVAAGSRAAATLRAGGARVELVVPTDEAALRRSARIAAETGVDAIVAAGGDGTANLVAQSCLAHGVTFGLVPSGTGNDNARSLGIPLGDPDSAARAVLAGLAAERRIDVGWAQAGTEPGRAFLGVLSTGFDSAVNERANRMRRLGGTARYVAALARELRAFSPLEYRIEVDGVPFGPGRALLASVGNGPGYGGGMLVCPSADPADGLLDLTVLGAVPTATFVRLFPSVYRGTHVRHPVVTTARGTRLRIDAPGGVAYADGERFGPLPVTVTVRPGALRVAAPLPA